MPTSAWNDWPHGVGGAKYAPAAPHVKLWPRMNTFESRTWSPASATASLMWLTPGSSVPVAVSTTVSPSISVSNGPAHGNAPAGRSTQRLLRYSEQFPPCDELY